MMLHGSLLVPPKRAFSRHGNVQTSLALPIWLNENVELLRYLAHLLPPYKQVAYA